MKALQLMALVIVILLVMATPSFAAGEIFSGGSMGAGLGAAFTIIGAGYGFGRIGSAALESMARQPEVAARVQTAMIVIAALLEGATLFALVICFMIVGKATF
jgi:F-type H+-transporting ATPase subunit c